MDHIKSYLVTSYGIEPGNIRSYNKDEILFATSEGKYRWSRVENYYTAFDKAMEAYQETFSNLDSKKIDVHLN